jgi:hypothetical protein
MSGFGWAGRLAALLVALVIPACSTGATPGKSTNSSLLWVSQAGTGGQSGSTQPVQWIDPNTGLGGGAIGVIQVVQSVDLATYARYNVSTKPPPFNQFVTYIFASEHPLQTDTSSTTITSKESELLGLLNGYRNQIMGNNVGLGGAIVVGGGSVVLPSFLHGTQCARAHCKHYAFFEKGLPLPAETLSPAGVTWNEHPAFFGNRPPFFSFPWGLKGGVAAGAPHPLENMEGDHVIFTILGSRADQTNNPGMLTPLRPGMTAYNIYANQGRLGKIQVNTSPILGEFSYSGYTNPNFAIFDDSINIRDQILIDDPELVVDFWPPPLYPVWSHICVGFWKGGAFGNYWDILFVKNPSPAN